MEAPEGYDYWQSPVKITVAVSGKKADKTDAPIVRKNILYY